MILNKWNNKKHKYEPYEIPDNWICKTCSDDMYDLVNCPHCGKELQFGDCYTSMEIHTHAGFGFAVCEDCYQNEFERRCNE